MTKVISADSSGRTYLPADKYSNYFWVLEIPVTEGMMGNNWEDTSGPTRFFYRIEQVQD